MATTLRQVQLVVGAAVVSCAAILAGTWPTDTQADDAESAVAHQEDIGVGTTKVGYLEATSRIVPDEKVKGKYYLEVSVHNTNTEGRETAQLDEALEKTVYTPSMGRSAPMPTVAWKVSDKVDVMPSETAVVRHALPAWVNWQVANSLKPPKLDKDGNPVMQSTTSFSTAVSKKS